MIEAMENLPDGVLGFRASGTVTARDYREVLDPAIDAKIAQHEKVNLVYVLGEDLSGYSAGALWQDAELDTRPRRSWGRIALVTDHEWIGKAVHLISFVFPCEVRSFALADESAALEWAAQGR
ncbi:STAS/SEC14 domain-containing protein [Rhodococcus sp. NPDC127528]|uniref:STAS/SEC14 domain-containing protein n=1 Tax=unclassified Rhodococcus (in: high G+C Gram-positive bacteria) TaxID=192944 RepID=UPI003635B834